MNNNEKKYNKILYSALIFLALTSICGAVVYKMYSLDNIGVFVSLLLSAILFLIIQHYSHKNKNASKEKTTEQIIKKNRLNIFLIISYLLLTATGFYILFVNRTAEAIISPWEVVPWYFFVIYGAMTAILILNILNESRLTTTLISIHYFFSFSIAVIIYKIGYGFDPFIHETTMNLIDKIGSVDPKPFYYLSQYSLIIILHKLTFIPIAWLNKLLVPFLAAVVLPSIIKKVSEKWFEDKKTIIFTSLVLLATPFSVFTTTVPQNFAYLMFVFALLLGLTCSNISDLLIIYLVSIVAILSQPIAGIPAFLFALLLTAYHSNKEKIKKYYYVLISILSIISLPTIFYYLAKNMETGKEIGATTNTLSLPNITIPNQENFILNFIYLYGFNIKIIIAFISLAGVAIAFKYRKIFDFFFVYLTMFFSLFLSYLITKKINFSFLIDYERENYADRILIIATLFLLPFILTTLYSLSYKIINQKNAIKIPVIVFAVLAITTSLYISYPRFDRYFNSRGYSTGQNDIEAVRWIENNSNKDYIVLANQQVSAAALKEFGFKKYYKTSSPYQGEGGGEVFFYPVPTGGPLYQYYLDMVYKKPTKETMVKAMDLVGVNQAYFVLNKYWWASPKILEEAKLEADSWQKVGQDDVYIFEYNR